MQSKILWSCTSGFLLLVLVISSQFESSSADSSKKKSGWSSNSTKSDRYEENYGQDIVGDDSYSDRKSVYSDEPDGYDGKDPSPHGQDFADKKPIYDDRDLISAALNVWIASADDWEQTGGRGRGSYKKPPKYDRKKRSYKKVTFPVRQYRDIKRFPINRFPPLHSVFPWIPIFYDKITYQTFIFSPTGGIYVLPPLINFFGKRFAVAQLIKWGYASLVSTGAPVPPNFNVAPLVNPVGAGGVIGGAAGGVVGGAAAAPPPSVPFNAASGQFNGGVTTDFKSFGSHKGTTY